MLRIAGTWSDKPGSLAIRYFLDEPISHIAFIFDERLVIHSTLTGFQVIWIKDFLDHNVIATSKDFNISLQKEEEVYKTLIQLKGAEYDKKAFAYFAYCALKKKYFGTPLPTENPWGEKNKYLCTELAGLLPDFIFPTRINPFKGRDLEMISPYQVIKEII